MQIFATCLLILVAGLHFWFMALEMFLWRRPIGLKTFQNSPEKAETTAVLAANQGLYNGLLALGLVLSFLLPSPAREPFQIYLLGFIFVAGFYGSLTVSRRIFVVQSLPAAVALLFVCATRA